MLPALLALLAAAAPPALAPGTELAVDGPPSTVRYHVVHKFHRVDGQSNQIEGKVLIQEGGKVLAMVRVPAASFRSGDGNRDTHMIEVLEAGKYPYVTFKGVGHLTASSSGRITIDGELDFHGVKRPVSVLLSLEPGPDDSLRARGSFEVSLDAHRIDRPSLLFVKIDDDCRIDVDLLLRSGKR